MKSSLAKSFRCLKQAKIVGKERSLVANHFELHPI